MGQNTQANNGPLAGWKLTIIVPLPAIMLMETPPGEQEERKKREERERKKAEVRARLEAQTTKPAKKGFMTPERKKKLRILLRRKAAEELKRQQEAKANERRRVISERTGTKKNFDAMSEAELSSVCKQFHDRIKSLESEKWDLEYAVGRKELEVSLAVSLCWLARWAQFVRMADEIVCSFGPTRPSTRLVAVIGLGNLTQSSARTDVDAHFRRSVCCR